MDSFRGKALCRYSSALDHSHSKLCSQLLFSSCCQHSPHPTPPHPFPSPTSIITLAQNYAFLEKLSNVSKISLHPFARLAI